MKIMVTGDRGYIGVILVDTLRKKGYDVVGYDIDYYDGCELSNIDIPYKKITKDIRDVEKTDLEGIDAIVHLAALSNDPLGELIPRVTEDVNLTGTKRLLESATQAGVSRFLFASSQSMYGVANIDIELEEDKGDNKNPVTAYAATKYDAETWLLSFGKNNNSSPVITCFRPSTVFGVSPKLRCDIVFNNLVGCAYTTGKIEIKTDGTPWRPVIHVRDVCQAFMAGLEAPPEIISQEVFNVGIPGGNYTVAELAAAAKSAVPGCEIIFRNDETDPRTYRVSFKKILKVLKDYYKPEWDLERGAKELVSYFDQVNFTESQFRGRSCNRLIHLMHLQNNKIVDGKLRMIT